MNISQKISEYLLKHGITHDVLAKKIGYTRANVSRILRSDNGDIRLSQLEKICKALALPVYYFFEIEESPELKSLRNRVHELEGHLALYRRVITDQDRKEIDGYVIKIKSVLDSEFSYIDKNQASKILQNLNDYLVKHKEEGKTGIQWICNFNSNEDIKDLIISRFNLKPIVKKKKSK